MLWTAVTGLMHLSPHQMFDAVAKMDELQEVCTVLGYTPPAVSKLHGRRGRKDMFQRLC